MHYDHCQYSACTKVHPWLTNKGSGHCPVGWSKPVFFTSAITLGDSENGIRSSSFAHTFPLIQYISIYTCVYMYIYIRMYSIYIYIHIYILWVNMSNLGWLVVPTHPKTKRSRRIISPFLGWKNVENPSCPPDWSMVWKRFFTCMAVWCCSNSWYPLVIQHFAIENGHF